MSTQELREKAHKAVDAVPDAMLPVLVDLLDEIQELPHDDAFEVQVKKIIEEKRNLLRRLAQ